MTRRHPYFPSRTAQRAAVLVAATVSTLTVACPVLAQTPSSDEGTAWWQIDGMLGAISQVPPVGSRPGMIVGAQAGLGSGALRLVVGAAYAREVGRGSVRCCGATPGFRYTNEAVLLGIGPELRAFSSRSGSLAFDLQFNPTWYHSIRSGSQDDFTPGPTEWHRALSVASVGAAWRWRAMPTLNARVGVRAYAALASLGFGAAPIPQVALTVGLGSR